MINSEGENIMTNGKRIKYLREKMDLLKKILQQD